MLTPAQKHLIKWLKSLGLDKDTTVGIMCFLDTTQKRDLMMQFLSKNRKADKQEILKALKEIIMRNEEYYAHLS